MDFEKGEGTGWVTADRVDVTHDIMDKHYDKATKNEQMEREEDYLVGV